MNAQEIALVTQAAPRIRDGRPCWCWPSWVNNPRVEAGAHQGFCQALAEITGTNPKDEKVG